MGSADEQMSQEIAPSGRGATAPSSPERAPGSVRQKSGGGNVEIATPDLVRALCSRLADSREDLRCRRDLGILRTQLWQFDHGHDNRFSREKCSYPMRLLKMHPALEIDAIRGASVLELGAGALNPFGALVPFLAHGADRVFSVDMESLGDTASLARFAYEQLADITLDPEGYLGNGAPDPHAVLDAIDWVDRQALRRGDPGGIAGDRLQFLQVSADSTSLPDESIDFAISVSFLEHVPDVDSVLAELARVLRPGGLASHTIDGRDHRCYMARPQHELAFLKEDTEDPIVFGCNRVRPLAFGAHFERHGLEVVAVKPGPQLEVSDSLRQSFAEPFRSMPLEHLQTLGANFHVRKV